MSEMPFDMLEHVKTSNGQAGNDYVNGIFQNYIDEVREHLIDAGIPEAVTLTRKCAGVVSIGVSDLLNSPEGKRELSPYFYKRAAQLACKFIGGSGDQ